jgi:hypothetical protein
VSRRIAGDPRNPALKVRVGTKRLSLVGVAERLPAGEGAGGVIGQNRSYGIILEAFGLAR